MSQEAGIFSRESLHTVVGVGVILGLLAVSLAFFNYRQNANTTQALVAVQADLLNKLDATANPTEQITALQTEVQTLKADLSALRADHDALKAAQAAAPVAPAPK